MTNETDEAEFARHVSESAALIVKVNAAKTTAMAARSFHAYLQCMARMIGADPDRVLLWSPEDSRSRGYGKGWAVAWEEGPYEWTSITLGCSLFAGENGSYSQPGPFPQGLSSKTGWFAEPYNHWLLTFYKD